MIHYRSEIELVPDISGRPSLSFQYSGELGGDRAVAADIPFPVVIPFATPVVQNSDDGIFFRSRFYFWRG